MWINVILNSFSSSRQGPCSEVLVEEDFRIVIGIVGKDWMVLSDCFTWDMLMLVISVYFTGTQHQYIN